MARNNRKSRKDGKYHIDGQVYDKLIGSRAQVMHGTAYKTSGGLLKKDLAYDKSGTRIVSKNKQRTAKMEKRLEKHGFFAKKGQFGYVKKTPARTLRNKTRKANTIGGKRRR
tara:strand:- start:888 stop:1223 length:336 start_codon:yes stop_codon:yes gene_type:complete